MHSKNLCAIFRVFSQKRERTDRLFYSYKTSMSGCFHAAQTLFLSCNTCLFVLYFERLFLTAMPSEYFLFLFSPMSSRLRSVFAKSKKYPHPLFPRALYTIVGSSWAIIIWYSAHFLSNHFLYCAYGIL